MIQNKAIVCSLLVLVINTHAMERKDWQKTPGQQLGGSGQQSSLVQSTRRPSSPPRRPATPPASAAPAARPATAAALAQEAAEKEHKKIYDRAHRRQELQEYIRIRPTVNAEEVYIASYDSESLPLVVSRGAVRFSPMFQNYLMDQERRFPGERPLLILDNSAEQVHFIAEVLSFLQPLHEPLLVLQKRLEQEKNAENRTLIEQDIKKQKQEMTTQVAENIIPIVARADISFAEAVELAHFFDLPIAFDALVRIPQPMPLPQTADEIKQYNSQLVALFTIAQSTADKSLWQLLGRMLYPRCLQYPECAEIVSHMPAVFEQIALGVYMQSHPELFEHLLRELRGHTDQVRAVAFSPDGRTLASASYDETIRVWNLADGSSRELRGHTCRVYAVAFSPDGRTLTSWSGDNYTRVWNLADGSSREFAGWTREDYSFVALSPDGRTVVLGSGDNTIRVWNRADGSSRELRGHTKQACSFAFSPDVRTLASGSGDNTIRVWNLADGSSRELRGHTDMVTSVAFSLDGGTLASAGSGDKTIRVWGYSSLREALQSPIAIVPGTATPALDGSSAAPSAPTVTARGAASQLTREPDEEELVVLADPRYDSLERPAIPAQE
jgi:hypothetical protein